RYEGEPSARLALEVNGGDLLGASRAVGPRGCPIGISLQPRDKALEIIRRHALLRDDNEWLRGKGRDPTRGCTAAHTPHRSQQTYPKTRAQVCSHLWLPEPPGPPQWSRLRQ